MFGWFAKLKKISSLDLWITIGLTSLVFFTPTNWFIKLATNQAYIHGLLSDYLLIKIYPTDLIVLILAVLLIIKLLSKPNFIRFLRQHSLLISAYGVFSLVLISRPLLSNYPLVGFLSALRLVVLSGLIILVRVWWSQLSIKQLTYSKLVIGSGVLLTVLLQSSLGLYQFFWQKSLLGYRLLGEVQLANPIGVTHMPWFGRELVLPYATTAHPNVLAGALVILLVIGWSLLASYSQRMVKIGLGLATFFGAATLIITASVSGILAGLLASAGILYLRLRQTKKLKLINARWLTVSWISVLVIIPIILAIFAKIYLDNTSILRRVELNQSALHMIIDQPVWGTGIGLFTANLDRYLPKFEPVVFLQPVHHVPLLFLAQTGLLGLAWLWFWWQILSKCDQSADHKLAHTFPISKLIIGLMIIPLLTLDHYLISLQTGLMLSALILFLGRWQSCRN